MTNPEVIQALIAIVQSALTQLGIPAVFVLAWFFERRAHQRTTEAYIRDMRALNKRLSDSDHSNHALRKQNGKSE